MRGAAALLVAALVAAAPARGGFDSDLDTQPLRGLDRALAASVAKAIPMPAASAGITFRFDPRTSAFERETDLSGQLFVERARPLGRGRLNLTLLYEYVDVDTVDGKDLGSLSDNRPIRTVQNPDKPFVVPHLDLSLVTHAMIASVTYGVTEDLDLNLTVPVLYSELDVSGRLRQLGVTLAPNQIGNTANSAFGVGDILVRGKHRLAHGWLGELAVGMVFRLPSGSQGDFQGTGLFEMGPQLYASTVAVTLAPHIRVQAHVNAGLDLTPQDAPRGEGRWAVAFDILLDTRATLSLALLAREPFSRLLEPGATTVRRTKHVRTPAFGIDPGHPSYYDLSIGGRVNLWRDTVFGIATVVVPVNEDGVRASLVPIIGLEAAF